MYTNEDKIFVFSPKKLPHLVHVAVKVQKDSVCGFDHQDSDFKKRLCQEEIDFFFSVKDKNK